MQLLERKQKNMKTVEIYIYLLLKKVLNNYSEIKNNYYFSICTLIKMKIRVIIKLLKT